VSLNGITSARPLDGHHPDQWLIEDDNGRIRTKMGSWRKVGAFLGLVPEDGRRDEFGDEYPDGDGYRDEYQEDEFDHGHESPYPAPGPRAVPAGYADEPMTHGALAVQPRPDLRRDESTGAIRPVTVKLTGFGEARVIGEKFREGKPVILDMTEMDDAGARRLVDFAAGLAFALRGSIDKVTTKVFMLLPPDTDVADVSTYESGPQAGYSNGFAAEPAHRDRPAYAGMRATR
jgi:cell division inhibitor SepF